MNEELANTANIALKGIIDSVTATKNFVLAELPEVVEQLLMYKAFDHSLGVVFCLLLSFATAYGLRFVYKKHEDNPRSDWYIALTFGCVFGVPAIILMVYMCFYSFSKVIQIWIAPKVYLLEYASELVK